MFADATFLSPCSRSLLRRKISGTTPAAVVITYASHLPPLWLLGLSAALPMSPWLLSVSASTTPEITSRRNSLARCALRQCLVAFGRARCCWLLTHGIHSWSTLLTASHAADLRLVTTELGSVLTCDRMQLMAEMLPRRVQRDADLRECLAIPGRTSRVDVASQARPIRSTGVRENFSPPLPARPSHCRESQRRPARPHAAWYDSAFAEDLQSLPGSRTCWSAGRCWPGRRGTASPARRASVSMRMDRQELRPNLCSAKGELHARDWPPHEYCHQRDHQPLRGMAFQRDGRALPLHAYQMA